MTMEHTPGPWTFEEDGDDGEPVIRGADGNIVAEVYPYQGPDYREPLEAFEANATLIAAAPDLLAALERLDTETRMKMPPMYSDVASPKYTFGEDDAKTIRAAIAKAKGGE